MSTLPAFASIDDLEARGVDVTDALRTQAALDDASAIIRVEAGTNWASIADEETAYTLDFGDMDQWLQDAIVTVCISVARRVLANPQGATSMSLGDASIDLADSSSNVYLTAQEKRVIHRAAGTGGLGYVDLEIGTPMWGGTYIDVGQTEPFPFTYEPLRP